MRGWIPVTGAEIVPAADEPIEGRIVDGPGKVPLGQGPGVTHQWVFLGEVWHDESGRLEERGRLDRAGCECADCLGDKYSGEDFY
jgi:hypothetical protein